MVNLRRALPSDIPVLCALRIEFLAEHRGVTPDDLPGRLADDTREFFVGTMASGRMVTWLAEQSGNPTGMASVVAHDVPPLPEDPRAREGYVINMYVRPGSRGRGTGRRLLDACLGSAGEQGFRRFYLYATASGRPMYEDVGFANHADWMVLQVPEV
jgi:GNAT superfamily N-acetyltransferase